ncbi:MAG TPA: HIT domain-containing protein [Thermodesulfovibrionales bacterium]|nr:HIT domain-containing protein [Thermodesulfovibrionales bacterium]
MHELRKDILLGRWVAVLSDSRSPSDYELPSDGEEKELNCVLCPGREDETPREITSIRKPGTSANSPGWWVRTLPSFRPIFQVEGDLGRRGVGIFDKMNSIGANEIIVESPEHNIRPEDMGLEQMIRVISMYKSRLGDLERDSRLRYILIYKDSGKAAGQIFSHPVSHIMATPVLPKVVKDELDSAKQYFAYKERCIFCDIIREELGTGERVIFETKSFLAFCPYAAQFPFESWIIPKRHTCSFQDISEEEIGDMGMMVMTILKKMRQVLHDAPFNYFIHTAPNMVPRKNHWHTLGEDYHWHMEIIPRIVRTSGFEWGSGFYILPTSPENAAKYLREV